MRLHGAGASCAAADLRPEQPQQHRRRDRPAQRSKVVRQFACRRATASTSPPFLGDLKKLYVLNDQGNSLTDDQPGDRKAGQDDPGRRSVQHVLHARRQSRDRRRRGVSHRPRLPQTLTRSSSNTRYQSRAQASTTWTFSADGTYLIASCEFSGQLIKVDVASEQVVGTLTLPDGQRGHAAGREAVTRRASLLRGRYDGETGSGRSTAMPSG